MHQSDVAYSSPAATKHNSTAFTKTIVGIKIGQHLINEQQVTNITLQILS